MAGLQKTVVNPYWTPGSNQAKQVVVPYQYNVIWKTTTLPDGSLISTGYEIFDPDDNIWGNHLT